MRFDITETSEVLVSQSGLALAGVLLQGTAIGQRLRSIQVDAHETPMIPHADNVLAMIGLVCLGKSDFEAINAFTGESSEFFRRSLGLKQVPSEPTLRQRLDALAARDASKKSTAQAGPTARRAGGSVA